MRRPCFLLPAPPSRSLHGRLTDEPSSPRARRCRTSAQSSAARRRRASLCRPEHPCPGPLAGARRERARGQTRLPGRLAPRAVGSRSSGEGARSAWGTGRQERAEGTVEVGAPPAGRTTGQSQCCAQRRRRGRPRARARGHARPNSPSRPIRRMARSRVDVACIHPTPLHLFARPRACAGRESQRRLPFLPPPLRLPARPTRSRRDAVPRAPHGWGGGPSCAHGRSTSVGARMGGRDACWSTVWSIGRSAGGRAGARASVRR